MPVVAVHGAQVPWGKVVMEGVPVVPALRLPSMLRQLPVVLGPERIAGLDLMVTWALEQKAAANRQLIAAMRRRLAAGEQVARMYQEPGLAWLERQAEVAEELVAQRKRTAEDHQGS